MFVIANHRLYQVSNLLRKIVAAKREKDQSPLLTFGFAELAPHIFQGFVSMLDTQDHQEKQENPIIPLLTVTTDFEPECVKYNPQ